MMTKEFILAMFRSSCLYFSGVIIGFLFNKWIIANKNREVIIEKYKSEITMLLTSTADFFKKNDNFLSGYFYNKTKALLQNIQNDRNYCNLKTISRIAEIKKIFEESSRLSFEIFSYPANRPPLENKKLQSHPVLAEKYAKNIMESLKRAEQNTESLIDEDKSLKLSRPETMAACNSHLENIGQFFKDVINLLNWAEQAELKQRNHSEKEE